MFNDCFLKTYQKLKYILNIINYFCVKNNTFTYIVIHTSHFQGILHLKTFAKETNYIFYCFELI